MLVSVCLSRREWKRRLERSGAGVGWVVGDSREEAVNGSLSDLNTNTDGPLILVEPYIPLLAPFLFVAFSHYTHPPFVSPSKFSNAIISSSLAQYVAFCPRFSFRLFFFFCLSFLRLCVFVVAVFVSEAEQSLIIGKRMQTRLRKTLSSTRSTERDAETGAQVLQRVQ